jgi:hypothetical protein
MQSLANNGYLGSVLKVDRVLGHTGWLIGGWPRSHFLGKKNYIGDIDVASTLREREIAIRLAAAGQNFGRNASGGFRLTLTDSNTIDILPVEHLSKENDLVDALSKFNFSVNSIAINLRENQILTTSAFKVDIDDRRLRVNDGFVCKEPQYRGFLKDIQFLRSFDGLVPGQDAATVKWVAEVDMVERVRSSMSTTEILKSAARRVIKVVPPRFDAWIVRGFARSAIHRENRLWDDIDIVTTARAEDIEKNLREQSLNYTYNIFGTPKAVCADGTIVDIWSINAGGLAAELSSYSHNVDAISWSLQKNKFDDPFSVLEKIGRGELFIQERFLRNASKLQLSYATLKALYLCIRHRYAPSPCLARLLNEPILSPPLMRKNAIRLAKELSTIYGRESYANYIPDRSSIAGGAIGLLAGAFL